MYKCIKISNKNLKVKKKVGDNDNQKCCLQMQYCFYGLTLSLPETFNFVPAWQSRALILSEVDYTYISQDTLKIVNDNHHVAQARKWLYYWRPPYEIQLDLARAHAKRGEGVTYFIRKSYIMSGDAKKPVKKIIPISLPDIIHTLVLTCLLLISGYCKKYLPLISMILHG